jgi:hypothetical protein
MTTQTTDLNCRLREIRQRTADAKFDRRLLMARLKTLSLEIEAMEESEAALMHAQTDRSVQRQQRRPR